ncbi:MAG: aminopeptidase P family protein [Desulfobacula sp.]|nr:aminopeptidase P family protein [Desulfobacula sp.]
MQTNEKIQQIREWMTGQNIDAVVIPSDDPHKSEYVAEHWQARKWLTGFSGSAGIAVLTMDRAILWTDFRYYIQAEKQIAGSQFELFKMGEPEVPSFQKWLAKEMKSGQTIGLDAGVFSRTDIKKIKAMLEKKGLNLATTANVIELIWEDRPPQPNTHAFSFPVEYAGKSRVEKIGQIKEKMKKLGANCHLMATLDDIAWTFNLRGKDVHTNPVNVAFALILPDTSTLFVCPGKIKDDLKNQLQTDGIEIKEYEKIFDALADIEDASSILIDPDNTNYKLYQSINDQCTIIEKSNPAILLKARKNDIEVGHIRRTAVKDGVAMVKFLHWLETLDGDAKISEISVAEQLYQFRKEQDLFVDNSFDPIMAYQDHSAMCHYGATKQTDVPIGQTGMFLMDSGGNYLTGTTDITRTVSRGKPSRQEITDYTLVLKGHICVATSHFPKGTKGFQIDTLARQFLWNRGMNFGHGTGHGVGFFLCVHEGPARISPVQNDVVLEKGMLLTNEPGVYREGSHGIRLENQILVDEAYETEFGVFLKFENVTFCHFEQDLIDENLLSVREKEWLNAYHSQVYDKVSPYLNAEVAHWLKHKTQPI